MLAQPGTKALYGYDYDVLGMVLGRAYEMTPEVNDAISVPKAP